MAQVLDAALSSCTSLAPSQISSLFQGMFASVPISMELLLGEPTTQARQYLALQDGKPKSTFQSATHSLFTIQHHKLELYL